MAAKTKVVCVVSEKAMASGVTESAAITLAKAVKNNAVFQLQPDERIEHHCVVEGDVGPIEVIVFLKLKNKIPWCFICLNDENTEGGDLEA